MTTDEMDPQAQEEKDENYSLPITREVLYKLVWAEPMLKVAKRFDVSSSYLARICTILNVPRPQRGYWARKAVGQTPPIPPLPEARPGDEVIWTRQNQPIKVKRQLPRPPSKIRRKSKKVVTSQDGQHPLIIGARNHFTTGRLSDEGEYYKPFKQLLVDLVVSKTGLDKALSFANELFLSLERKGHHVVIAPKSESFRRAEVDEHEVPVKKIGYNHNNLWTPWRCTVVYMGTLAIGLTIIEMSEEVEVRYVNGKYIREKDYAQPKRRRHWNDATWTTQKDYPTGRLCLQAYSPYWRAKWMKQWRETEKRDLNGQIRTIIRELEKESETIVHLVEEGERQAEIERQQWEAQQEKWRREKEEARVAQALKDSKADLIKIIEYWAESKRIEAFFQDAERKAAELGESERLKIMERLKLARELIGSVEALDYFSVWRSPDER